MRTTLSWILAFLGTSMVSGLIVKSPEETQEFEVISNPHASQKETQGFATSRNLDYFLEPYYLMTDAMETQLDSFQEISSAKVLSVPVPIYRMKQPARLSSAELEFSLVLVRELSKAARSQIQVVQVDMEKAKDSWFPGYYWSPLALPLPETNEWQHVGWKFTSVDSLNSKPSSFYALMIQMDPRKKEGVEVRLGGWTLPAGVGARIFS